MVTLPPAKTLLRSKIINILGHEEMRTGNAEFMLLTKAYYSIG